MNCLCLLRGCSMSRADGPNRLISNGANFFRWNAFKHSTKLTQDHIFSLIGLTFVECLTDANDGLNTCGHKTFGLNGNGFIVLTPKGTTFRVTHKCERDANVSKHGGRHFTCKGTFGTSRNRFGTDFNTASF